MAVKVVRGPASRYENIHVKLVRGLPVQYGAIRFTIYGQRVLKRDPRTHTRIVRLAGLALLGSLLMCVRFCRLDDDYAT